MTSEKYQLTKTPERSTPRFAIVAIAVLIISMIVLVVMQGLKAPDSSTQAGSIDFTQTTGELTPGQDMVITLENFTVVVPKDATALAGSVTIIPREPNLFPFAGAAEWTRPQVINVEYRNGLGTAQPSVTFTKPVLICFKLTPELWLDYNQRPSEYQVQYYDETQHPAKWVTLPTTAYPENMHLCGQVDHLSLFALAIKVKGSIPITGATVTPTLTQVFPSYVPEPQRTPKPTREPVEPAPTINPSNTPMPTEPPATEPSPTEPPTEPPTTEPSPTEPPTP